MPGSIVCEVCFGVVTVNNQRKKFSLILETEARMQLSHEDHIGESGELSAEHYFAQLGWGPLRTHKQDLGTDLFVQVRDEDRTDLRLMIGVQVKTGNSWFSEPGMVDGQEGWWFRESDKRHAEYWSNHHIPHILIVQTEEYATRVWARLDSSTIQDTGKGIKVFVRSSQTVDASSAGEWRKFASQARRSVSFEGSRWSFSVTQLPESDWLRFALIAPRLVAPHPNRGTAGGLNWAEAISLCLDGVPERWDNYAEERADIPDPSQASTSSDFHWKLAGAVYSWLTDSPEELRNLDLAAASRSMKIGHAVVVAISWLDQDLPHEALRVLDEVSVPSEMSADQAWLEVHRARVQAETVNPETATDGFRDALLKLSSVKTDVTVSAIRAAAILALYELTDFQNRSLEDAVPALDTVASWWRNQATATALRDASKRTYRSWTRDKAILILSRDTAHNELFCAALAARLAGDHSEWRATTTLMAMVDLSTKRPDETPPDASLDSLRRAGSSAELAKALKRIREVGPVSSLTEFMMLVLPENMTRTSWPCDLAALAHAGSYVAQAPGEAWVEYLLETLKAHEPFVSRFGLRHSPVKELLEGLGGIAWAANLGQQSRLAELMMALPEGTAEVLDRPLRRLIAFISEPVMRGHQDAARARLSQFSRGSWMSQLITLFLRFGETDEAHEHSHEMLSRGDFRALADIPLSDLQDEEMQALVAKAAEMLVSFRAPHASYPTYYIDAARFLAEVAIERDHVGAWELLLNFLLDETAYVTAKRKALNYLSEKADKIPEDDRLNLLAALQQIASRPLDPLEMMGGLIPDIGGAVYELVLELLPFESPLRALTLARLLTGTEQERFDAVNYMSRHSGYELTLVALTSDENFRVAHRSILGLARRIAEDAAIEPLFVDILVSFLKSDEEASAKYIIGGLRASDDANTNSARLVAELRAHASAEVRRQTILIWPI